MTCTYCCDAYAHTPAGHGVRVIISQHVCLPYTIIAAFKSRLPFIFKFKPVTKLPVPPRFRISLLRITRLPLRFRMAEVKVVDVGATLPPARGIPVTFRDSFRSWLVGAVALDRRVLMLHRWSVGERESAASEERLLRCVSMRSLRMPVPMTRLASSHFSCPRVYPRHPPHRL